MENKAIRKPLFRRENIIKLQRLLNMKYKPAELAKEIGVSVETVYKCYLKAGAPHVYDNGKYWINGEDFKHWAKTQEETKKKHRNILLEGQAWCIFCKKVIDIQNPKRNIHNRYLFRWSGTCPICKGKVNVFDSRKKGKGGSNEK